MIDAGDRDIVIRHIVVTVLPNILARDALRMQELDFLSAYGRYLEKLMLCIESEQREVRSLLRSRNIKIIELHTRGGVRCRYWVSGYEELIDMPPSVIKTACDNHLQNVLGGRLNNNI